MKPDLTFMEVESWLKRTIKHAKDANADVPMHTSMCLSNAANELQDALRSIERARIYIEDIVN